MSFIAELLMLSRTPPSWARLCLRLRISVEMMPMLRLPGLWKYFLKPMKVRHTMRPELAMLHAEAKERQRAGLKRGSEIPVRSNSSERGKGKARELAAAAVGIGYGTIEQADIVSSDEFVRAGKGQAKALMTNLSEAVKGRPVTSPGRQGAHTKTSWKFFQKV